MYDDKKTEKDLENSASLDETAERLLRDIENTSPFILRTSSFSPEDLDPSDVAAKDAHSNEPVGFEEEAHMEVPVVQAVQEVERVLADEAARAQAEEKARRSRRRLRNTLILVLIILAAIGAVIGVSVWRNSMDPDVKPSDTESLITSSTGTSSTVFNKVDTKLIPNFAKLFGKKIGKVQQKTQGKMVLKGENKKAKSAAVKSLKYLRSAILVNDKGARCADITLGLDKKKRLVYVHCLYDLDMLSVADADFKTLVRDGTVAASLAQGMGVPASVAGKDAFVLPQGQEAAISNVGGKEEYTFTGGTGLKKAPTNWELTETYDHSVGKVNNDNSVIRTIGVKLR